MNLSLALPLALSITRHDNFGLPKDQVIFFNQGTCPCFTLDGKLMLSAPGELAEAPDGNGGMYVALRSSGVLSRLQKEGVTGIFQFGVDNVRHPSAPRPHPRPHPRPPAAYLPPPLRPSASPPLLLRRNASAVSAATWPSLLALTPYPNP